MLNIAALSMQHRDDFKNILPELKGSTQYVMEYLFNQSGCGRTLVPLPPPFPNSA
jgi:hypothetical protein